LIKIKLKRPENGPRYRNIVQAFEFLEAGIIQNMKVAP
jgi:hypothetical protein